MHAVRNIRLCTKDCLCLYVCPVGATDTETGQIDAAKCISGCRLCVDACPSHAISLVPETFPPQQGKSASVQSSLRALATSKVKQEQMAMAIAESSDNVTVRQLVKAIAMSNHLMAEDLLRESGFMLPQSQPVLALLKSWLEMMQPEDFPRDVVEKLISLLEKSQIGNTEDKPMAENKTLKNLMEAFAGESQANRKYLAYSKKPRRMVKRMPPNFSKLLRMPKHCMP